MAIRSQGHKGHIAYVVPLLGPVLCSPRWPNRKGSASPLGDCHVGAMLPCEPVSNHDPNAAALDAASPGQPLNFQTNTSPTPPTIPDNTAGEGQTRDSPLPMTE